MYRSHAHLLLPSVSLVTLALLAAGTSSNSVLRERAVFRVSFDDWRQLHPLLDDESRKVLGSLYRLPPLPPRVCCECLARTPVVTQRTEHLRDALDRLSIDDTLLESTLNKLRLGVGGDSLRYRPGSVSSPTQSRRRASTGSRGGYTRMEA